MKINNVLGYKIVETGVCQLCCKTTDMDKDMARYTDIVVYLCCTNIGHGLRHNTESSSHTTRLFYNGN